MTIKKILTGAVALVTIFSFTMGLAFTNMRAPQAQAAEVMTQFNRDMTIGATGADVAALQTILEAEGYLIMPVGVAKGYFGPLTRAALAKYQAAHGISPAVGYFGPITRAYVNTHGGTTPPSTGCSYDPNTGAVIKKYDVNTGAQICPPSNTPGTPSNNGDEGRLTNIDETGGTDSSVEEGDTAAKVLGVSMEVKDGDVMIERVDVDFDLAGSSGSKNLAQYISSVSLWLDGKKLDEQDVDQGDRNGDVTSFRFSGLKGNLKEGDSAKLYVAVDAVDGIDAEEQGEDIDVEIPVDGIRTLTGNNVSETYDNTALNDTFSVGQASTGDVTLTSDESDNPDVTVEADDQNSTNDVTLLKFSLKSKDQKNTIREINVDLVATGATSSSVIIDQVRLLADGDEIDSKNVASGANSVNFDDLDLDINEDDSVDFEVVADINELDGNDFSQGDSVAADIDSADVVAEDENGEDASVSGSAEGGIISFRTEGISLSDPSATESVDDHGDASATDSTGEYTISFKVNAFGDTVYIPLTASRASTAATGGAGVYYTIEGSDGITTPNGTSSAVVALTSGGSTVTTGGVTYAKVNDGQSATLKLSVSYDPAAAGFFRAQLQAVNFHVTTAAAPNQQVRATPEEDYETDFVNII